MTNGLASLMCIANQNKTRIKSSKPRDAKNMSHLNHLRLKQVASHHKLLNSSKIFWNPPKSLWNMTKTLQNSKFTFLHITQLITCNQSILIKIQQKHWQTKLVEYAWCLCDRKMKEGPHFVRLAMGNKWDHFWQFRLLTFKLYVHCWGLLVWQMRKRCC